MYPDDVRYAKTHEWVRTGDPMTVGISHFAQDELGDLVYVDLPAVGQTVTVGGSLGSVESVKTVSEVYAPVAGEIVEVNSAVADHPELVNEDPYGQGWLVRLRPDDASAIDALMTAQEYQEFIAADH